MEFTSNQTPKYITTKKVESKLSKSQTSPKRFITLFKYCKVFQIAFNFKNQKTVRELIKKWYKVLQDECDLGKDLDYACKDSIYEAKRANYREVLKIVNLSKITKKIMKPEIGLIFSICLVYSTFVFEQTAIDLTLENVYKVFSDDVKKDYSQSKFIADYFKIGTSKEVQNILYNKNI